MSRRKKIAVGEEDDGYKCPLSPNGHLSRGTAALKCDSAALRQYRTSQDSKGKSEV